MMIFKWITDMTSSNIAIKLKRMLNKKKYTNDFLKNHDSYCMIEFQKKLFNELGNLKLLQHRRNRDENFPYTFISYFFFFLGNLFKSLSLFGEKDF